MKKMILLALSLLLLGALIPAQASYVSGGQHVCFTYAANSPYWAFIWDYTAGVRESATTGFTSQNTTLAFYNNWNDVQVAYLYNSFDGRYTEALAIRDIRL